MKYHLLAFAFAIATGANAQQPLTKLWTSYHDGAVTGTDGAVRLITNQNGDVFVTGQSFQSSTNGSITTVKYDSEGTMQWTDDYGGNQNSRKNRARDLCMDPLGFLIVTGDYAINDGDFCIAKYNDNGRIWGKSKEPYSFGSGEDFGRAVSTDAIGNIYCVASTQSLSGELQDMYTAKFDSSGNLKWGEIYSSASGDDWATGVAVAPDGNSFSISSSYNFFGSATYDCQTIHYDTSGNEQWISSYNFLSTGSMDYPEDIKCDADYNTYVCGSADAGNQMDMVAYRQNLFGTRLWTVTYNGTANSNDTAIAIQYLPNQFAVVIGRTKELVNGAVHEAITTMLVDSGTVLWTAHYFGDSLDAIPTSLAVDADGNIYVAGYFSTLNEGSNAVILVYSQNGDLVSADVFDGAQSLNDRFNDVTVDDQSFIYVTGQSFTTSANSNYVTIKYDKSIATAIEQGQDKNQMMIFPNPVKRGDNIRISVSKFSEESDCALYDIHGRMFFQKKLNAIKNSQIETSLLNEGIYFLKIFNDDLPVTKKIIVME